jgi:hypothetical protein
VTDETYRRVVEETIGPPRAAAVGRSELIDQLIRQSRRLREQNASQRVAITDATQKYDDAIQKYDRLIATLEKTIALVRTCTREMREERLGQAAHKQAVEVAGPPLLAERQKRQRALLASLGADHT